MGKNKIPNRPPTDERVDISNPATIAETSEKIGRRKKLSSFCGKDSERKFAQPTTSESPQKNRTSKIERGTLKNRVVSSIFLQKAKVFEINRVKKKPTGRSQPLQRAGVNTMGGESALPTNPK